MIDDLEASAREWNLLPSMTLRINITFDRVKRQGEVTECSVIETANLKSIAAVKVSPPFLNRNKLEWGQCQQRKKFHPSRLTKKGEQSIRSSCLSGWGSLPSSPLPFTSCISCRSIEMRTSFAYVPKPLRKIWNPARRSRITPVISGSGLTTRTLERNLEC